MEEHGFRVEVKEDSLMARLEGFDKEYMVKSLMIIGYLTIHTRQLDMIMEKDAAVHYYRSKIMKDIETITKASAPPLADTGE